MSFSLSSLFQPFSVTKNRPFNTLEKQLRYRFRRPEFLAQAFTHRSVNSQPRKNYERLEFLGDAIIDIIVSEWLITEFPEGDEGMLTQKRSALVKKEFLGAMGHLLGLTKYLRIESTVKLSVDKIAVKQRANLFEALIGAIYLDGGLAPCKKVIRQTIWTHRRDAWKTTNYKGRLIEYCHSHSIESPRFLIANVSGPDHQKTFEIHVKIGGKTFEPGLGSNKKTAEQTAAQHALEYLQNS